MPVARGGSAPQKKPAPKPTRGGGPAGTGAPRGAVVKQAGGLRQQSLGHVPGIGVTNPARKMVQKATRAAQGLDQYLAARKPPTRSGPSPMAGVTRGSRGAVIRPVVREKMTNWKTVGVPLTNAGPNQMGNVEVARGKGGKNRAVRKSYPLGPGKRRKYGNS